MSGLRERLWNPKGEIPAARTPTRTGLQLLLAVVVVILGLNWPIMATAVDSIPPIWMGIFRVGGASLVVFSISLAGGRLRLPPRSDLPIVASVAIFRLGGATLLIFTALQMVPAGRSSVLTWTTPLWAVPIAALFLGDRMTRRRWAGLATGICGVIVLFEPWNVDWRDTSVIVGHLLLLMVAVIGASTSVHIRAHRWTVTALDALPWQLAGATVILLLIGLTTEGLPTIDWTWQLAGLVAYQGMLASGLALWAQIVILRNIDPVSANLTMMGVPAIGVTSSVMLLDEPVTAGLLLGLLFVLSGVGINLLGERSDRKVRPPTA